jgi:hypothetical protein
VDVVLQRPYHWVGRAWRRTVNWFGFRGAALLIFSATFFGIGVGVLHSPVPPELFYAAWPVWLRVGLWGGSATLAATAAIVERPRWQAWGFGALFLGPIERSLAYWVALGHTGELRWMVGACVWALVAALVALIAAWPEPPERLGRR